MQWVGIADCFLTAVYWSSQSGAIASSRSRVSKDRCSYSNAQFPTVYSCLDSDP